MSPAVAALVIVLACSAVLFGYWHGLVREPKGKQGGPMAGGGGPPPPPLTGSPNARVAALAGNGESGMADGAGAAARFDGPNALALGPGGVLFVTDSRNHRLRQVTPAGEVTTLAGSGPTATVVGAFQDGPAASARLSNPSGIAAAPDGTIYFADTGNHRIRFLKAGQVGTLAGGDTPADETGLPTGGFADGPAATARFRYPTSLGRTADGSLLVVDTGNCKLRRVTPQGVTSTVADLGAAGAKAPFGLALAGGTVYVTDPGTARVFTVSGASVAAVPGLGGPPFWKLPTGIAVGGDLFLSDAGTHCLVARAGGGAVLLAGVVPQDGTVMPSLHDGPGSSATFACPAGLLLAPDGRHLYVADYGNNCLRVVTLP